MYVFPRNSQAHCLDIDGAKYTPGPGYTCKCWRHGKHLLQTSQPINEVQEETDFKHCKLWSFLIFWVMRRLKQVASFYVITHNRCTTCGHDKLTSESTTDHADPCPAKLHRVDLFLKYWAFTFVWHCQRHVADLRILKNNWLPGISVLYLPTHPSYC